MNEQNLQPMHIHSDDHRFDRLIDGELSPAEYRRFLATLDDEPGAWRRCALAFLEAQALQGELGQVRGTFNFDKSPATTHRPPLTTHRSRLHYLAIAASFILAFGLGIVAPRFFFRGPQESPRSGNISLPVARDDRQQTRHQALRPIGNVRLVMDGPEGESSLTGELPFYDGDDLDQLLRQQQPALAPELVELLRQRGHSVEQQRQLVPVELDDGRQLVVPIEGYQITPVRYRAY